MPERILNEIKKNKSLWYAIRLRFYTIISTFTVLWFITGNPVTSIGATTVQQSVSFGVSYWFDSKECKPKPKEPEQRTMDKEWKEYGIDNFL